MFSSFRKTFGLIKATQLEEEILVEGVPGHFITVDIGNIWKTSKIAPNLFNKITRSTFSVPNFFALDLLYILERIISSKKRMGTNKQTAQKIIDALKESTWLGNLDKKFPDILDYSKVSLFWKTPLDFQKDFLDKYNKIVPMYNLKGYLLAGTAGSGKTFSSLLVSEMLHSDYVIIVCPPNATHDVWWDSISNQQKSEYKKPRDSWVAADNLPYVGQKYLIAHYEALNKLLEVAKKLKGKITIILDESHNLNNDESQRSRLFIDLCDLTGSENIIWCSGTPIKAMGSETIVLFRTIDKNFNDVLKFKYKKLYGKDAKKALDILSNRLDLVMHKVEKSQLNILEPNIQNLSITAPNSEQFTLDKIKDEMTAFIDERRTYYSKNFSTYKDLYDKCVSIYRDQISTESEMHDFERYVSLVKQFKNQTQFDKTDTAFCNKLENTKIVPLLSKDLREQFLEAKSVVKYVHLKIQGECLGRVLGKRRMECAKLIADYIPYVSIIESTQKKTLVFTSYVEVLEKALDNLKEIGLKPAAVYAKTNHDLSEIIEKFRSDKDINPLVATFNSLSTAVPLVMADVLIMINSPFRDYVLQQTISRINRLGADTQTYVYMSVLNTGNSPNLSTRTIDILKWSQSQVSAIMGIEVPFQINEDSVSMESELTKVLPGNEEFIISLEELTIREKIL
jgi:Cdc6-like AAA superfamily ATPase